MLLKQEMHERQSSTPCARCPGADASLFPAPWLHRDRVSAAPPGVKGRAPPKANPKTSPRKTDQAAPAPAPTNTTPANAKAAAAPGSTTEAKGTASTKTTATRDTAVCTNTTGGTGGRAKAGKAKAAGAPAGLTEKEREAAARVGAAIGRYGGRSVSNCSVKYSLRTLVSSDAHAPRFEGVRWAAVVLAVHTVPCLPAAVLASRGGGRYSLLGALGDT